jgi:hypothetical protein
MTFFFDNHHSPELVEQLRERGVDAMHLRDQFSDQGLDDVQWLPEIAARGWILITGDHRLRSRREEKPVFLQARLITFFSRLAILTRRNGCRSNGSCVSGRRWRRWRSVRSRATAFSFRRRERSANWVSEQTEPRPFPDERALPACGRSFIGS